MIRAARPSSARRRPFSPSSPAQITFDSFLVDAQLWSFFGMGSAELAVILVAGLVVVSPYPSSSTTLARPPRHGLGDEWSELKAIPEEFQKGLEVGEIEARGRKAKSMEDVGEGGKEES
eukprot:CAMPEP_0172531058 /NCGR_PEP_ID=MMETSP1067-20121228/4608_1 /TAXON_ID=265564 ORGANISM="Thalassiosira punctigera, Strain Tpunct2005C2" /NCGR_SAMPLE_ID=MMETSP1067 /ASSEMBLY_ACC=CAM_ASM_000444 /LENGTH=118 /DNA_ID=CAMNT_0013315385 /DNA_START=216 /DNA_END=572 /DNA_ORIENTATION=+